MGVPYRAEIESPPPVKKGIWENASVAEKLQFLAVTLLFLWLAGITIFIGIMHGQIRADVVKSDKNRATVCRALLGQGQHLRMDGVCLEPSILEYYDPVEVCDQLRRERQIMCVVEMAGGE